MIYFYWYLGIGVLVLALVYGEHHLTKEKESDGLRELLEAVNPDRKKPSYRILNNIVIPFLAAMFVIAVWPVAVFMKTKEMFQKKKDSYVSPEKREFAVEREHLQERLTVQEIERREVVADPLRAAPELPFGHLNTAWQAFLKGHADGTELWSFSARWQTTWGNKELRCGYIVVQNELPGDYFLTVWREILDETKSDVGAKQARANS